MRALSITALAAALLSAAYLQAGPREDAQARAALELSLALQRSPKTDRLSVSPPAPVMPARDSYATAYYAALKSGKPLVIHVAGFDCRDACTECLASGKCLTCDAAELYGDSTPRMILASPTNGKLVFVQEWKTAPDSKALQRSVEGVSPTASPFVRPAVDAESKLPVGSHEALDELNALRVARGLKPYVRDEGLTIAAANAATKRANGLIFGHLPNDFACLPSGCSADAAGCAAYPADHGWLSCCMWDSATYAGAAYAIGADGKRYMHLFIRR